MYWHHFQVFSWTKKFRRKTKAEKIEHFFSCCLHRICSVLLISPFLWSSPWSLRSFLIWAILILWFFYQSAKTNKLTTKNPLQKHIRYKRVKSLCFSSLPSDFSLAIWRFITWSLQMYLLMKPVFLCWLTRLALSPYDFSSKFQIYFHTSSSLWLWINLIIDLEVRKKRTCIQDREGRQLTEIREIIILSPPQ